MSLSTSWLAIPVAALATFAVGALWYSPWGFLRPWQSAMRLADADAGHPARVFGLAYAFSLAACFVLAQLVRPGAGALVGLHWGLMLGLGCVAASFGINYQFANRPAAAWLIDGGYHVVQFAAFGLVLGAWPA